MEHLDEPSPQEQADAAALECERLCRINGNPLTKRAFTSRQQHASPQGIDVRVYTMSSWLLLSHAPDHPSCMKHRPSSVLKTAGS